MSVLIWSYGTTRAAARQRIEEKLSATGYGQNVVWNEDNFKASVGWGTVLDLEGHIEDRTIVLDRCRGALGSVVLEKCASAFKEMFPEGHQVSTRNPSQSAG